MLDENLLESDYKEVVNLFLNSDFYKNQYNYIQIYKIDDEEKSNKYTLNKQKILKLKQKKERLENEELLKSKNDVQNEENTEKHNNVKILLKEHKTSSSELSLRGESSIYEGKLLKVYAPDLKKSDIDFIFNKGYSEAISVNLEVKKGKNGKLLHYRILKVL